MVLVRDTIYSTRISQQHPQNFHGEMSLSIPSHSLGFSNFESHNSLMGPDHTQ